MADIKTRDAVKGTIKTIDKAAVASERMKSAYSKIKDKAEQGYYAEESSATEYAADRVSAASERITNETKLIRYVRNLASLHMRPYELAREQAGKKATNQMFDSATVPSDLILFSTADQMGKGKGQIIPEYEDFLKERLDWYQYTMAQPCVMGADLIKAGLKPGPKFSEILAYSHDLHLSNVPKDEALAQTLAFARRLA